MPRKQVINLFAFFTFLALLAVAARPVLAAPPTHAVIEVKGEGVRLPERPEFMSSKTVQRYYTDPTLSPVISYATKNTMDIDGLRLMQASLVGYDRTGELVMVGKKSPFELVAEGRPTEATYKLFSESTKGTSVEGSARLRTVGYTEVGSDGVPKAFERTKTASEKTMETGIRIATELWEPGVAKDGKKLEGAALTDAMTERDGRMTQFLAGIPTTVGKEQAMAQILDAARDFQTVLRLYAESTPAVKAFYPDFPQAFGRMEGGALNMVGEAGLPTMMNLQGMTRRMIRALLAGNGSQFAAEGIMGRAYDRVLDPIDQMNVGGGVSAKKEILEIRAALMGCSKASGCLPKDLVKNGADKKRVAEVATEKTSPVVRLLSQRKANTEVMHPKDKKLKLWKEWDEKDKKELEDDETERFCNCMFGSPAACKIAVRGAA